MPLLKKVGAAASNESSRTPLDLVARNHHVLLNYVPGGGGGERDRELLHQPRKPKEPSPDLIEIQAQIEAIRYSFRKPPCLVFPHW